MGAVPKTMNQREARTLLKKDGWQQTAGGKHGVKMEKDGMRPITLPGHRGAQYSKSLTRAILQQAGLI